ncbi:J domain-containing protein [Pseudozobellia thermophila]|uniref:DnaJ domain-containing protein n=1 Tax=Pseudozobellia thermophila TaxID=192903 RepID=A0A1M6MWE9_9FLAO|nr:hypothetical protein [Pseudozobellia thermophila]SHJ87710.1 hypothetical protein SAMN04488513_11130 [Pseudozobellia thermophila]
MKTSTLTLTDLIKPTQSPTLPANLNSATENSSVALEAIQWINWWYVAITLEGLVVLFILVKLIRAQRSYKADKSKYESLLRAAHNDFGIHPVEKDSYQAQKLYRVLCRKCHPDRFKDQYQKALAHELFQEISIHRGHYAKLAQLKVKAERHLGIKL